ncbi:putative permease (plasmid) [Phaeobacter inhibens]|uniref:AEC family transporter n=1 Tax=Phaeobacter inhibens TaxID=221822 RepID=UPI000C99A3E6|nr:AEC family transporter [Phaeobacter inhibens]AUR05952.1 putative permease [Phaeobacter inhibens]UWR66146.1 AEC family transporter [Phaeobacter inhibens]UWR67047.1 AEC family transporter [Phaeobacter inhibens]UWR94988.1 AEC family transporter [Phaeobacter inhibens]
MTGASSVALALAPDILIIALGMLLGRFFDNTLWVALDKLCFYVFFPALMFTAAAARPIGLSDIASIGVAVWVLMGLGFVLALPLRRIGPASFLDFAGVWQTAWRFNAGLAFVVAQALPEEAAALIAVAIGLAVPLANVLAVGALARGAGQTMGPIFKAIVTNPFFLASSAGLLVGATGHAVPGTAELALDRLANVAIPAALLSIGASLSLRVLCGLNGLTGGFHLIKLVLLPLCALGLAELMALSPTQTSIIVLFAALPTAAAAQTLAVRFGADRRAPAAIIAQSTGLACVTLPVWIALIV